MAMNGKAVVVWSGSLANGNGHAEFESGTGGKIPVTCAMEDSTPGKSSPEELLAAAHASCFSMALSQILTMQGKRKIEKLRVAITTTLDQVKKDEPFLITREEIDITGKVGDIDEAGFMKVVEMAKTMCAVGLALKGNVKLDYKVHFEA
ncbi:MAG: OsmC family peroxiredoxin [Bacteroidota bacterium]|nr:OsmC family peroxiredoxin [Bacteroidota bacterium]